MSLARIPLRGWLVVSLLLAAATAAFFFKVPESPPEVHPVVNATVGVQPEATPSPQVETENKVVHGVVSQGDTAGKILQGLLGSEQMHSMLEATRKVYSLGTIKVGQPYTLVTNATNGTIERFEYEIDDSRKLVVHAKEDNSFKVLLEPIPYEYELARVDGTIDSNLFQAVADMGESPALAITLADIFGWEVDFIRDIQSGDSFSVLVEKRYRDGEFKGYGRVLASTFTNNGQTYEAFLFTDDFGGQAHYGKDGRSLRKSFLKAPLSFTRISSGFSSNRLHPIFKTNRPHPGIDYAASTGTPVKSVANGVVVFAGWSNGYGNQVTVKHSGNMETMYSHLSGFAKGTRKGTRVKQGEVIGYVGATGWATGPHLDFRVKQGNKFVNPSKMMNPRNEPIAKKRMNEFKERMALITEFLEGKRDLTSYDPSLIKD